MNVKRRIGSHIRGWFPQEPRLGKTVSTQSVHQVYPPLINYGATRSSARIALGSAIVNGIVGCIFVIFSFFIDYTIDISDIFWILTGTIFGCLTSVLLIQRQLKQLIKKNQVTLGTRNRIFEMLPIAIFGFTELVSGWLFSASHTFVGYLTGLSASIAATYATKYLLFLGYERRRNVIIKQQEVSGYVIDPVMFALPKPTKGTRQLSDNSR
jgi:hypothetical protein